MSSTVESGVTAGTWTIDPAHSEVGFTVRHLMSKVRGQFAVFSGSLTTGETLAETTAEATIDVNSIDTRDAGRDAHLRSADFFDVENSGPMTFHSTSFDGTSASGELTIKGVTKPVTLDVEFLGQQADPWGNQRIGFEANTEITRQDWGITFNVPLDGGKFLVGDKVKIVLAVEAVLNADEPDALAPADQVEEASEEAQA